MTSKIPDVIPLRVEAAASTPLNARLPCIVKTCVAGHCRVTV